MIVDTENNYIYLAETPNSHLLIMGQSGSGKTYYCNRKIEQEIQKTSVLPAILSVTLYMPRPSFYLSQIQYNQNFPVYNLPKLL